MPAAKLTIRAVKRQPEQQALTAIIYSGNSTLSGRFSLFVQIIRMSTKSDKKKGQGKSPEFHFVFDKRNYTIMLIGLAVIVLGFALMYGKDDIYGWRKIQLAPVVVIAGFVIEIFAILRKPEPENDAD